MYWRTASGHEVDLVIERGGGHAVAIECKYKERPDLADAAGLCALEQAEKGRVREKIIVCRTPALYRLADGTWVMNVADVLEHFSS